MYNQEGVTKGPPKTPCLFSFHLSVGSEWTRPFFFFFFPLQQLNDSQGEIPLAGKELGYFFTKELNNGTLHKSVTEMVL